MPPAEPPRDDALLARLGMTNGAARIAVVTVLLYLAAAAVSMEAVSEALVATKEWVIRGFDWLFVASASLAIVGVLVLALHPRANVRLGPDDARPEFGTLAWLAMLFSAGLASGLLYWATAEPVLHYQGNPFLEAGEGAPHTLAMRLTVLHWGLHGWAFYVLAGLGMAIYAYRHGRPLAFRTALRPVLGPVWVDRWPGRCVDLVAVFGTVAGVATSIGISSAGLNATLGSLFALDVSVSNQLVIVAFVCGLGVASAVSGLTRGIRRLSEVNLWVSAALLTVVVAVGPTLFLGELLLETLADYVVHLVPTGLWVARTPTGKDWQAAWTVFYWGWWLAWTPFVGLFIARISRGRTVREFAVAVTLVPTLVTVVWMTVLGGTALHQEMASAGAVSAAVARDYSLGIVAVIGNLAGPGLGTGLMVTATFLLFTWLITSLDSATLVISHLLASEDAAPAKVFWGVALAAVTAVLLLVGGLPALQAASIVIGLPLAVLVLSMGAGLILDLVRGQL
jgi:choline/glycine/proline betaine transport protein